MRVLALTFGDEHQASSKYRVYQYIEPLRAFGIDLEPTPANTFNDWLRVPQYDAVVVQKKLFASAKVRRLRRATPRLIYDIDDAIWHPHGKEHTFFTNLRNTWRLKAIARAADLCVTANNVLADHLRRLTAKVIVLPLTLDGKRWQPKVESDPSPTVRIGWAGHPVNLPYLEAIEPALVHAQGENPNIEFAIFCGKPPAFRKLKYRHVPFQPDAEINAVRTFDVGILPLPPGPFAAGKSPIKGLQYMATAIPTILTPVGATRDMFQEGETALFASTIEDWQRAISRLVREPEKRARMGKRAREKFLETYELARTVPVFASALDPAKRA
jgi:glycosyltransferase involved in cell wall biosynthesis